VQDHARRDAVRDLVGMLVVDAVHDQQVPAEAVIVR
jgi:hypothetical protein